MRRTYNNTSEKILILPGKFSVSADKYVQFSRGNLRYTIATDTWSFFNKQYECGPSSYSAGHDKEISLFTWGYDAAKSIIPDGASTDNVSRTSGDLNLSEDWGYVFGGASSPWRTLTISEWQYLLGARTDAASKVGFATVGGVQGIIFLPDTFTDPMKNGGSGAFKPKSTTGYSANVYTSGGNWEAMEAAGAVFLPAANMRQNKNLPRSGYGYYWSSSASSSTHAFAISFLGTTLYLEGEAISYNRSNGNSVRLVQRFPKLHDAVKIGDIYWATCNIGADTPKDYGWYFSWGDTEGYVRNGSNWVTAKDGSILQGGFNWNNAPFNNGSSSYDAAYFDDIKNTVCPNDTLTLDYDAAHVNWGENWRMPTSDEFNALKAATKWTWDSTDKGYYVTNKGETLLPDKSNALLFFPAAGYGTNTDFTDRNIYGYYWSSTLEQSSHHDAYYMYFNNAGITPQYSATRRNGRSIRPVKTFMLYLDGEIESYGKLPTSWNSEDTIAVYDDVSRKIKMKAVKTSDQTAEFEPETEPDEFSTMAYAVYPYDAAGDIQVISEEKVLQLTLPSTQSYVKNSSGRGANVAVGQISGDNTKFMNVCGLLCLNLKRADVTVSRIELRANDGAKLSGSFAVDLDEDYRTAIPFGERVEGDDVITLDCGASGVTLSDTSVSFYFAVPVGVFGNTATDKGGFTATVITTDNKKYYVGTYNNTNVIVRSSVCEMSDKTVSVIPDIHYDEAKYIESSNATGSNNGSCVVWKPASSVTSLKTTIDGYKLEDRFSTSEVIFCINHYTASDGYWFGIAKDKNQWGWGTTLTGLSCLGSSRRAVMTLTCVQNTKSKVSMYKTSATGTTYSATSNNGITSGDEIKTVSLFAGNFKDGAGNHYCGKFRIYSVKFISSNKTIGNLVPAYDKSAKKYGFYDLTQKKFFGNHADATKILVGELFD